MVLMYITSTLYHSLARNKAKRVFQILDHGAIFLLIAGTYTPILLGVLYGGWGWTMFGLVWGLALAGGAPAGRLYVVSVLPSLVAWPALLLDARIGHGRSLARSAHIARRPDVRRPDLTARPLAETRA